MKRSVTGSSRRRFLQAVAGISAIGAGGVPQMLFAADAEVLPPGDRLNLGFVGVGGQWRRPAANEAGRRSSTSCSGTPRRKVPAGTGTTE